jgi:hypothetical protein
LAAGGQANLISVLTAFGHRAGVTALLNALDARRLRSPSPARAVNAGEIDRRFDAMHLECARAFVPPDTQSRSTS